MLKMTFFSTEITREICRKGSREAVKLAEEGFRKFRRVINETSISFHRCPLTRESENRLDVFRSFQFRLKTVFLLRHAIEKKKAVRPALLVFLASH